MTGCGHSKDVERNVLRVGVVLYTQDDPFINALTECLRDELKKYESDSFKIIMTVRYGKNDQNIQDEAVGEILDAGCDILAVDLVDRTEPSNIIKMAKTELKQIKIKLVKSLIGASEKQRRVVAGLGLTKQNQVVEHYNSATILGMVNKVPHLVEIVE